MRGAGAVPDPCVALLWVPWPMRPVRVTHGSLRVGLSNARAQERVSGGVDTIHWKHDDRRQMVQPVHKKIRGVQLQPTVPDPRVKHADPERSALKLSSISPTEGSAGARERRR
jgi:hypothetical protein